MTRPTVAEGREDRRTRLTRANRASRPSRPAARRVAHRAKPSIPSASGRNWERGLTHTATRELHLEPLEVRGGLKGGVGARLSLTLTHGALLRDVQRGLKRAGERRISRILGSLVFSQNFLIIGRVWVSWWLELLFHGINEHGRCMTEVTLP